MSDSDPGYFTIVDGWAYFPPESSAELEDSPPMEWFVPEHGVTTMDLYDFCSLGTFQCPDTPTRWVEFTEAEISDVAVYNIRPQYRSLIIVLLRNPRPIYVKLQRRRLDNSTARPRKVVHPHLPPDQVRPPPANHSHDEKAG